MINAPELASTRPYLIRALYEWCTDNGFTPYVAVQVDDSVQVPREYVKNGEIVLNISFDATSSLKLGNDFIEFKARFSGTAREIMVPVGNVIAVYARENGQGMAFPPVPPAVSASTGPDDDAPPVAAVAPSRMPLRDASRGTEGDANNVVHLGGGTDGSPDGGAPEGPGDDPPRPPSPTGAKPSLKRVK
jgi:stringent starvation protein B